jgi:hypothetical protein
MVVPIACREGGWGQRGTGSGLKLEGSPEKIKDSCSNRTVIAIRPDIHACPFGCATEPEGANQWGQREYHGRRLYMRRAIPDSEEGSVHLRSAFSTRDPIGPRRPPAPTFGCSACDMLMHWARRANDEPHAVAYQGR